MKTPARLGRKAGVGTGQHVSLLTLRAFSPICSTHTTVEKGAVRVGAYYGRH